MKKEKIFPFILSVAFILAGYSCCNCHNTAKSTQAVASSQPTAKPEASTSATRELPPVIIYKMTADYRMNIPVIMNEDKTEIVSFPSVKDVYVGDQLAYPIELENGYFLDVKGINKDVAFLKYTYEEYSKMKETPPMSVLKDNILEKNPLQECYYCGKKSQYSSLTVDLNEIIKTGQLEQKCKRIK